MTVEIGFTASRSFVAKVIGFFTRQEVSHAFIVHEDSDFGGRFVIEAGWNGYRVRPFIEKLHGVTAMYLVTPKHDVAGLIPIVGSYLGQPYDYRGLAGAALVMVGRWFKQKWKNPLNSTKAMFCSEAIVLGLQAIKYPGAEQFTPDSTTPEDLLQFFLSESK